MICLVNNVERGLPRDRLITIANNKVHSVLQWHQNALFWLFTSISNYITALFPSHLKKKLNVPWCPARNSWTAAKLPCKLSINTSVLGHQDWAMLVRLSLRHTRHSPGLKRKWLPSFKHWIYHTDPTMKLSQLRENWQYIIFWVLKIII